MPSNDNRRAHAQKRHPDIT